LINTSLKSVREKYKQKQIDFDAKTKEIFRRSNIDYTEITTDKDYIKPLMNLFKRR